MLRHAVDTVRLQEVSLREELATLRLYTQIQQVRFGDRLRLTWEIEDSALEAAVPHMLLQPLVENAIKHGLEAHSTAGRITIAARREREMLRLVIRDDGPGRAVASPRRGAGLGLANVRTRLAQLYPEQHSFEIRDADGGGTEVTIWLPFIIGASTDSQSAEADLTGAVGTQPNAAADLPADGVRSRRVLPGDESRPSTRSSSSAHEA